MPPIPSHPITAASPNSPAITVPSFVTWGPHGYGLAVATAAREGKTVNAAASMPAAARALEQRVGRSIRMPPVVAVEHRDEERVARLRAEEQRHRRSQLH